MDTQLKITKAHFYFVSKRTINKANQDFLLIFIKILKYFQNSGSKSAKLLTVAM